MDGCARNRVPHISPPLLDISVGCTLQYVTAWHKYVLLDPAFAQLPISTDQLLFEELVFDTVHLRKDGSSGQIELLPNTEPSSFHIFRVFHEYIFPKNGQHHLDVPARANRIHALWRARPELDEFDLTVNDLISTCGRLLPQQVLAIIHPTQLLSFQSTMELTDMLDLCRSGAETTPSSEPRPICVPPIRLILGSEMGNMHSRQHASLINLRNGNFKETCDWFCGFYDVGKQSARSPRRCTTSGLVFHFTGIARYERFKCTDATAHCALTHENEHCGQDGKRPVWLSGSDLMGTPVMLLGSDLRPLALVEDSAQCGASVVALYLQSRHKSSCAVLDADCSCVASEDVQVHGRLARKLAAREAWSRRSCA
ncbi:hypothetical protein BCR37DRAFT_104543 [Protomyces lactucae-debilis]|uniref:Uncharacterized protein n=1 Tax=Protomyces lactucae-debilis TaxID=2754530 RepID=A0A1Y2F6C9_PROLT|nr:uncharacterized protein BCR37DRAFT_104543 [Protomyces lactucae-debilis]ORY78495.1 hypothetical protein BCR37DRAFT_104543 [Protomyces lactucae-debilis]